MRSETVDLAAIRAFVTVGESGGFRAAATTLGMTSHCQARKEAGRTVVGP
jgi:hypothetical protein